MTATVALAAHRLDDPVRRLTGIGRYVVSLAEALTARGTYRLLVLAPFDSAPPSERWIDQPIIRVGGDRRLLLARWALVGRPRVDRLVPEIDLVHVGDAVAPVPTAGPAVYTVHDLFPLRRTDWTGLKGRALFRAVVRRVRRGAQVIVPSQSVADEVLRRLAVPADRVTVIPEGVSERFRDVRSDPGTVDALGLEPGGYWLTVGGVAPRKNTAHLLDALAATTVSRALPLVVAGPPGPGTSALVRRAAELGLSDRLILLGFVPDPELPGLLAGARALLHPSLDEGFGLPPLEAMAAGTPVIASRAGALPETIGDAGILLSPTDTSAWARALDELAADDDACRELSARGRDRAAAFTWDRTAALTEEVYAACLDR